jgi:myo-inositol 2-dehydrogenase/D-chiro-inositol 1-dehydrogenase
MSEPAKILADPRLNRRSFIQSSSLATGAVLAGGLAAEKAAHAQGSDLIKIALVGCGGRGTGAAAQALSTKGNVQLVAMADAFPDRLEGSLNNITNEIKEKEKIDVPPERRFFGFDAYKHAISLADVVVLATPPGFRPIHFAEAVKQGKHVFMEKPVAIDGAGVQMVLNAAEEAKKKNLKVGVGLQRRHQAGYIETIKRLHDGAIGDIVAARCYWNDGGVWVRPRQAGMTEMEYQMRNWYYFIWLCGDHICEQHIHNLDVINWVKGGPPVRCHGMGGRQVRTGKEYGEIFDHHAVEFEYEDGSRLFSQCRHIRGCWSAVSEHVIGTKGTSDLNAYAINGHKGYLAWKYRGENPNPYQVEHDDLFDAIRNDKPYNEAFYGATSSLTSVMGRVATYTGKPVDRETVLKSPSIMPKEFDWTAQPPTLPGPDGFYPVAIPGA